MGTNTRVEGRIYIQPPLTEEEFRNSPIISRDCDVSIAVECEILGVDREVFTGVYLFPTWEGPYKAYNLVEHVQAVIDEHPDHTFTGHFECTVDDGTLFRIVIRDRKAVKIFPRIVWDDEEES